MSTILAISGSPSATSRTARLVDLLAVRLADAGHQVHALSVRDLPPAALLGADPAHPAIEAVAEELANADGLLVATPVYKASYSGALKSLLDLLPQYALAGKVVLPLATGGTLAHVLAIDYAMRPVLSAMGAAHIVPGYFLLDQLILTGADGATVVDASAVPALYAAVDTFARALAPAGLPIAA
ncbi:SsuE family FMN reductase [Micromonospora pisi]|uniref:SsuE family FMN reductase n=1 Tax=Micromonospora pisi TaxID=589240 RepID=A0A495JYC0_9ACTN|nr:NADPH-dependent FMN reductase [Micromonospora pisi]RKR93189.1 SsuE family FMN reductase [Micromonospora pisi]